MTSATKDALTSLTLSASCTKTESLLLSGLVLGFTLVGCGDDMPAAEDLLAAPPAGQGVQYRMTSQVAAGQEIERCQFFVVPGDGFAVHRDEVRYTPGSHHVLLYKTPYKSVPTVDRRGKTHDTSGVFDCAEGATADWEANGILSASQSLSAMSSVQLPDNAGITVPGGTVLLMNTHYLNASQTSLDTTAAINLYTIPKEQVAVEAGVTLFYNPFILVPAHGQSSARMRCPVTKDVTFSTIQSHMHKRGVGYVASSTDASGAPSDTLYQTNAWAEVPVTSYSPGKLLRAGTAIDYHCDYQSSEDHDVYQGFSTRDEMCVLIGSYYPRDEQFESCANPFYVGSGTTDGATTLSCIQAAGSDFQAMTPCVVKSCPAITSQLTALFSCKFTLGNGACQSSCTGDQNACASCVQNACKSQITALAGAGC